MTGKQSVPANCVDRLLKKSIEKAESNLLLTRKIEMNIEGGEFSLMRTTDDVSLRITGISGNRSASTVVNKTGDAALAEAVLQLENLIESGEIDPSVDIAGFQREESFTRGPAEPDTDKMYARVDEFVKRAEKMYPTLILEQAILDHTVKNRYFANSNGVRFASQRGAYNFMTMFTSKEGKNTSSFNYSAVSAENLNRNLWELGTMDMLMKQSTEQTTTGEIPGTFTGDVIITPDCLSDFMGTVAGYLKDYPMMTGTSIYRNSLNTRIADDRFTLRSMPVSEELSDGYFVTADGFKAENCTIVENGVLRSFLLSLYGSRKTGLEKAVNTGSFYVVDPGDDSLEDMMKSVERGLLLCRFSGGSPSSSGDFSGVAKNSYYIENGEIRYPVSETMVAGNIKEMLNSVKSISAETVNNGFSVLPWITFSGITVSGK